MLKKQKSNLTSVTNLKIKSANAELRYFLIPLFFLNIAIPETA